MNNNYNGLNDKEVINNRNKYGSNVIKKEKRESFIGRVIDVIKEPMFILLLCAASVYFIVGEYADGFIMLLFVFVICIIEFKEEEKTSKAIEELNKLSALDVKVIRNSKQIIVDSKDIVVNDIVILKEGDKVPADGIILECEGFGVDESLLTGESKVIYKTFDDDNNHFKSNYCYDGTIVTNGSAIIRVTSVGINTELGKIGQKINNINTNKSPLENQVNKFVLICTIISIIFFVLVIVVNFINYSNLTMKNRIIESIISGITIAMATIPEEIPVILTVFLCLGSLKLSKENTLVRNNRTIETLSAMTVLCSDKTGTLTQNKMIVEDSYNVDNTIAYLSCEVNPYDPMEIAIKKYFNKIDVKDYEVLYEYIFNNEDKMMGKLYSINNSKLLCVKGAYEKVLSICNLNSNEVKNIENRALKYANKGYRVIAIAKCGNVNKTMKSIKDYKLEFCGLIALSDPPREGVKESIQKCIEAGIRIIMITGDSADTAIGIAKNLGITNNEIYITGDELEKINDKELIEKVKTTNIFARVYPEHKMRIVEALQTNGEIVGMTGDGINDAPALKKADIGIAMAKRGTTVAKEAADIVLLDDNFNTIISAISNGRSIYNNIKRSMSYILAIHIPIALLSLIIPLLGLPNLLLPIHIVLLELLLDPTSSIIFQRIKPDKNIMKHSPRNKDESIINGNDVIKCISQGLTIILVVLFTYMYLLKNYSVNLASTISYSVLLVSIILIAFNLENDELTLKNVIYSFKDKLILFINGAIITALLLFIYLPFSHKVFDTCNLSITNWIMIIILSMIAVLPFDILKIKKIDRKWAKNSTM